MGSLIGEVADLYISEYSDISVLLYTIQHTHYGFGENGKLSTLEKATNIFHNFYLLSKFRPIFRP